MTQQTIEGEEAGLHTLDMTSGLLGMQWETKIHAGINLDASAHRKVTVRGDFTRLPFQDETFEIVLFDPPHTIDNRNTLLGTLNPQSGSGPHLAAFKYGCYRNISDLRLAVAQGAVEAFRVLLPSGCMVFKWSNSEKPFSWAHDTILKVAPFQLVNIEIKSSKANPKNLTTLHSYRKLRTIALAAPTAADLPSTSRTRKPAKTLPSLLSSEIVARVRQDLESSPYNL